MGFECIRKILARARVEKSFKLSNVFLPHNDIHTDSMQAEKRNRKKFNQLLYKIATLYEINVSNPIY